ncbi:MAG: tetratricopeptide repeat protein [Gammaproteobacteria bacterium]|nr:tetratricopeptide repeat protein [Gammaproteobacteria bacterium]
MHRFIRVIVVGIALLMIGSCADTGPARTTSGAVRDRSPVPISAAQRNDFNQALGFMKKEQYEKALPLLEGIYKENDSMPGTNINLAIAYMKLADEDDKESLTKAENALTKAIEINPRNEVAQFQLGLLYRKTGRFELSRKAYEQALKVNRNYAMAHYNLGILCDIYLQQPKCAIEHFENYQKLVPQDAKQVGMWLSDIRRRAGIPEPMVPDAKTGKEG